MNAERLERVTNKNSSAYHDLSNEEKYWAKKILEKQRKKAAESRRKVKDPNKVGIYGIFCHKTKKAYIGQSKDCQARLRNHKAELRRGEKQPEWQKDWDELLEDDFEFKVLENCLIEELDDKEQEWCLGYFDQGWSLYNKRVHQKCAFVNSPQVFIDEVNELIDLMDKKMITKDELSAFMDKFRN
jgi:group I intron endonuclease